MANLVSVEIKRTKQVDLSKAISAYLRQSYADDPNAHPEALKGDLATISKLRSLAVVGLNGVQETHPAVLRDLMVYFCQLAFIATKFNADVGVDFPWFPIYDSQGSAALSAALPGMLPTAQAVAIPSMAWERAAILFNIAATYSRLAANEPRKDTDGIKRSISLFQNAAGCFDHLRSSIIPLIKVDASTKQPLSPELSDNSLKAFASLSLAQAQECSWQKSVLDNLKNGTIAKLSMQASVLYGQALDLAHAAQGTEAWPIFAFPSAILTHMNLKKAHFAAVAQFRKSKDDLAESSYGSELGRLQLADSFIKEALALPKRDITSAALSDLKAVITDNLTRAAKDNDLIYLQPVRTMADLQPITPANLVKATLPAEIANPIDHLSNRQGAFGRPLFDTLVPYSVQLAISIYDSRKEDFLKSDIVSQCDRLDAELTSQLQSLDLPAALQALDVSFGLPAALISKAEEVRSQNGPAKIRSMFADIARLREANRQTLIETISIIDNEEREDGQLRQQADMSAWNRLPSIQVNPRFRQRLEKYWQTLEAAQTSDQTVLDKYEAYSDRIQRLGGTQEDIEALIPSAQQPSRSTWFSTPAQSSVAQHAATRKFKATIEDLDTLANARRNLCSTVKRVVASDDIRPLVLQESGSLQDREPDREVQTAHFEPLFAKHLAKYQLYRRQLEQNAQEQVAVLDRIQTENRAFKAAKTEDATLQKRQDALQEFDIAFSKYKEVASNLSEGLKFYGDLANLLSQLRQECQNYSNIRHSEASQIISAQSTGPAPSQIKPGLWDPNQPIRFGS